MIDVSKMTWLVVIAAMLMLNSCSQEETAVHEDVIRPVRYQKVMLSGGTRIKTFTGAAKSGMESNLSFKVGGTVERINVKVGDSVRKGHLIATVDSSDYQLQVQQAEAQLEQAKAQAINAKANYERVRGLYENQNASKSDLDSSRAAFESANASVQSIEKQVALTRSQSGYTRLSAPFSGAISAVHVEVNENVRSGAAIVTLTGQTALEVSVAVPEIVIADITRGASVVVKFDAIKDREFKGAVSEVGIAASTYSSTYPVIITLQESVPKLRAGMAAEVAFTFHSTSDEARFFVPSHAVSEDQHGRFVYIVQPLEGNLAVTKRKNVTVGELTSEGLAILDGLQEGDLLVTAGVSRITEDMKVKLLEAKETQQ